MVAYAPGLAAAVRCADDGMRREERGRARERETACWKRERRGRGRRDVKCQKMRVEREERERARQRGTQG